MNIVAVVEVPDAEDHPLYRVFLADGTVMLYRPEHDAAYRWVVETGCDWFTDELKK